ncbi:hypothetical protein [Solibacillus sp. FSL H8-0538]|uniref:hypothetical protein n=1 Tax=Solibacillus sp. FSL H8-0538 TaxID=2921400 RepID=UPI0030F76780
MLKSTFIAYMLGTVLLVGCNTNTDKVNEETPMEDVKNGVNNGVNDVENGVNEVIDDVENGVNNNEVDMNGTDTNGTNGQINEGTINNGNGDYQNGVTAPDTGNNVNNEDIIEDKADRKDKDNIDNR